MDNQFDDRFDENDIEDFEEYVHYYNLDEDNNSDEDTDEDEVKELYF